MSLRKYETYVRKLLINANRLEARQFKGVSNATDELLDLATAIELAGLTEKQREALRLVYLEDFTQAEVGLRFATSQANISLHIDAAIRKIAEVYRKWDFSRRKQGDLRR